MTAVDGSYTSTFALQEAIKLAKNQKATLKVIHVIDENFVMLTDPYINYQDLWQSYKKRGEKILADAVNAAQTEGLQFESQLIELRSLEGRISEKIASAAQAWPADLLVIGTHGRRGFSRLLLGSVAEGIIRMSTIPILLIHAPKPDKSDQANA